jgi:hypothetical protein
VTTASRTASSDPGSSYRLCQDSQSTTRQS